MLQAYISFDGSTGRLLNYVGNCQAIQSPSITRTGPGQYTVSFLTARKIDAAKIAAAIITVDCQSPSGTATLTNVLPSPVSVFNAAASSGYTYQICFKIEITNLVKSVPLLPVFPFTLITYVDRPIIMLSIVAKNQSPLGRDFDSC